MQLRQVCAARDGLEAQRMQVVEPLAREMMAAAWGPGLLEELVGPICRNTWFSPSDGVLSPWDAARPGGSRDAARAVPEI